MHLMGAKLAIPLAVLLATACNAFQVAISDADPLRQTCSGMWAGKSTRIESECKAYLFFLSDVLK